MATDPCLTILSSACLNSGLVYASLLFSIFYCIHDKDTEAGTVDGWFAGAFETVKSEVNSWGKPAAALAEDMKTWSVGAQESVKQFGVNVNNWGDAKIQ